MYFVFLYLHVFVYLQIQILRFFVFFVFFLFFFVFRDKNLVFRAQNNPPIKSIFGQSWQPQRRSTSEETKANTPLRLLRD
jgi:hypothetical protein